MVFAAEVRFSLTSKQLLCVDWLLRVVDAAQLLGRRAPLTASCGGDVDAFPLTSPSTWCKIKNGKEGINHQSQSERFYSRRANKSTPSSAFDPDVGECERKRLDRSPASYSSAGRSHTLCHLFTLAV